MVVRSQVTEHVAVIAASITVSHPQITPAPRAGLVRRSDEYNTCGYFYSLAGMSGTLLHFNDADVYV